LKDRKYAILWDMDGTIVDTEGTHFLAWEHTLKQNGFNLSHEIFNENFGRNNHISLPIFLGFDPSPELYLSLIEQKETYFRQIALESANLVPGVLNWFSEAKTAGLWQVVASSASMMNINWIIDGFQLRSYFDHLISGSELPAKPEPDVFLITARMLDLPPENCVVVEDSSAGVLAAKRAGMTCIGVTTSLCPDELSGADVVLNDFTSPIANVFDKLGFAQDLF
jgi:HAD superfamily hydrolase (TIGR01509 family)